MRPPEVFADELAVTLHRDVGETQVLRTRKGVTGLLRRTINDRKATMLLRAKILPYVLLVTGTLLVLFVASYH